MIDDSVSLNSVERRMMITHVRSFSPVRTFRDCIFVAHAILRFHKILGSPIPGLFS